MFNIMEIGNLLIIKSIFIRKELKNRGCTKFANLSDGQISVNFVEPWFLNSLDFNLQTFIRQNLERRHS